MNFQGCTPELSSVAFNSDSNWSTDSVQLQKMAQFAAESVAHFTAECLDQFAPERVAHFAAESVAGLLRNMHRMRSLRKRLGYMEVTLQQPTLFGEAGTRLRGHEFHYSELCDDPLVNTEWETAYLTRTNRDGTLHDEGYYRGEVLVSYVHLHLASTSEVLDKIVSVLQKPGPTSEHEKQR